MSNQKNFVHLVGLKAYRKMMHGAYKIKLTLSLNTALPYRQTSYMFRLRTLTFTG